jgi:hypothetical protein
MSFPWFWQSDAVLAGVMSNIFASVVILPFVIWGIDRALRDIERRRRAPRDQAIRNEFGVGFIVNGIVGAVALSGNARPNESIRGSALDGLRDNEILGRARDRSTWGSQREASTSVLQRLSSKLRQTETRLERLIAWGGEILEPAHLAEAIEAFRP